MQNCTVSQACSALNIGRTKLYQLINSGQLSARKIGKRTIILGDDLQKFISDLEIYSAKK